MGGKGGEAPPGLCAADQEVVLMLPEAKELLPLEMEVLPPKLEDMLESRVIILLLEILNLHKDLLLERKVNFFY
uniref:Uncharacterized protein n=1 Tax=Oryza sativa subsp. japonica TaxID=39947 RepID=Q6H728_ORYSJ|nr:hypothetical protein [Oryza sativa Japonica Group]